MANNLKKVTSFPLFDPSSVKPTANDALYYVHKTSTGYDSYAITLDKFFLTSNAANSVVMCSNTFIVANGSVTINGSLNVNNISSIGSIENTPIGQSVPTLGKFTNLTCNNALITGTLTETSDIRLKSNILKIDNALDKISQLNGYTFTKNGERLTGVIAQEIVEVLPEAVIEHDGYLSVSYGNLVGLLIEAIKEQQKQIEDLKNR